MFDLLKDYLFNLIDRYFGYFLSFIISILTTLVGYLLDLLTWFFELLFSVFDALLRFIWKLAKPLVISCLESGAEYLPAGWFDYILGGYEWFQYINEWVPVEFAIKLFVAYYGIAVSFYATRVALSFVIGRI